MAAAKSRGTRRLAGVILTVVTVIGVIAIAVPSLISSDAVKKRISDQITNWTGRTFTFTGDAKLRLFPYLTVRLQDARLAGPDGMEGKPFVRADVLVGKLEILPLLMGRLEFAEFRLGSPKINLTVDAAGMPNWILDQGVVGTLASKGDSELSGDDGEPPTPRADIGLGRFLIRGGTVTYDDARNGTSEVFSDVDVDFNWRSTIEALKGDGSFVWREREVAFRGEISTPLTLLAGGNSQLRIAAEADPAKGSFNGMARQFDGMQLEGNVKLKVPSLARFAEWTSVPFGSDPPVEAATIAGRLFWAAATLNLNDLSIDLDGSTGEGAVTATLVDGTPSIQGTLDFGRIDLTPYLAAGSRIVDETDAWQDAPIDLPLIAAANLDLRLSAGEAVAYGRQVGPAAASLLVKDGAMLVEIGEAHLGEGTLESSFRIAAADGVYSGKASFKADDVPAQVVTGLFGISGVTGTAVASADLTASGATFGDLVATLAGEASFDLADGTLAGLDLASLPQMLADPEAAAATGDTAFSHLDATFVVADGKLSTDDLRAEGDGYVLALAGHAALTEPTIAARGVLSLADDPPREVPFLVTGTWEAPHLQPDLGGPLPRGGATGAGSAPPEDAGPIVPGDG